METGVDAEAFCVMQTMKQSIQDIVTQLEVIKENFKDFKSKEVGIRNMSDIISGEYELRDIIDEIDSLVDHLDYLTRSHNVFRKLTTLPERNNLHSYLANLNSHISNSNFGGIVQNIDQIKILLRPIGVFTFNKKENIGNFVSALENLKTEKAEIEAYIDVLKKLIEDKKNAIEELSELENTFENLKTKLESAEEKEEAISELLTASQANKKVIDNFALEVTKRDDQLAKQQVRTDEYEQSLHEYKLEHDEIIKQATRLIENAKTALNLATTEGISGAIQSQFMEAKKLRRTAPWLASAFFFILLALVLGVVIAFPEYIILFVEKFSTDKQRFNETFNIIRTFIDISDWKLLVGRIALLPILILGAVFSTKQYVRQKNIIEDYRYKLVLVQSLVGFSEQFLGQKQQENHAYKQYVESVLKELLQDPLRQRGYKKEDIDEKTRSLLLSLAEVASKFTNKS